MPNVILTGLGGAQQSTIAAAFSAAGWTVGDISRTVPGTHRANLETGEGLEATFAGADLVVFTPPQDHTPCRRVKMAEAIATAAAQVPRVILNAASGVKASDLGIFQTTQVVRDRLPSLRLVTVESTVYMGNLVTPWSLRAILSGTLAYPALPEVAVAWMSHRTLADAVVAAATAPVLGQRVRIGGPAAITGTEIAATLAAHLDRPMSYAPIPLPGFAAGLNEAFGPPAGDRFAELYAYLADHPESMADGAEGLARLGVTGERFSDFIARQRWTVDTCPCRPLPHSLHRAAENRRATPWQVTNPPAAPAPRRPRAFATISVPR